MRLLGKDNTAPIKELINAQRTAFGYRQRGSHKGAYQSITGYQYKKHSTLDKVFQLGAQHNMLQN